MKLDLVGTVISTDGKFSEDSTIRVTAVDGAGNTLTGWMGTVAIAEDGTNAYAAGNNGGTIPSSVTISSGGTTTFVAKSLAGPKSEGASGQKPDPAMIKTTNYPVWHGSSLPVAQWIISGSKIDPLAGAGVYDWVQARAKAIFDNANGLSNDVVKVLAAVKSYTVAAQVGGGQAFTVRGAQSPIVINPYYNASRVDGVGPVFCGNPYNFFFTNAFLHEARHAYQAQIATDGNDQDQDWLVNHIDVAPTTIFLDTASGRAVCNDLNGSNEIRTAGYHGDTVPDSWLSPDNAYYALEMDALVFATKWFN